MASNAERNDAESATSAMPTSQAATSKVAQSIAEKGEHSYYFAHARPKEDLSKAAPIQGDGTRCLAKLDGMQQLDAREIAVERKVKWREDYAWCDDDGKAKLYLDLPQGSLGHPDAKVEAKFSELGFEVVVREAGGSQEPVGITNGEHRLSGKIVPDKCSWRINSSKSRLTVTLVKAEPEEGAWSTLKKHVISQHTGWN